MMPMPEMKWFISPAALAAADVPDSLSRAWSKKTRSGMDDAGYAASSAACVLGGELLREGRAALPPWIDSDTRFLVIKDMPLGASMKLPTILNLHKPDQRLHLTGDLGCVRRWMTSAFRDNPFEGIVDAYVVDRTIVTFLGDLTIREFPKDRVPSLKHLSEEELRDFEIDADGSFLHWSAHDIHLGPSQLLQAVDPAELADIEIGRYRAENTAAALKHMRESKRLTQTDIQGLSDRQVSRLENGRSRLTADAAEKWATALGMDLVDFLQELGGLLSYWKHQVAGEPNRSSAEEVTRFDSAEALFEDLGI